MCMQSILVFLCGLNYLEIKSSILEHSKQHNHRISFDNLKIITKTSDTDLKILEQLYIHKFKPNLNEYLPVGLCWL